MMIEFRYAGLLFSDVDFDKIEIGMRVRAMLRKLDQDGDAGIIHYGYKFVPEY